MFHRCALCVCLLTILASFARAQEASTSSPPSLRGKWNPDIGVLADTVLLLDTPKEDEEGADRLSVRELEIVFGSNVDPYCRLDATLAISDFEEAELEEACLTHYGIPWEITVRLGRFKPYIGKAIPLHRDSLDTVDEPQVVASWFGHHGYSKTGVDFSKILPLPWDSTHQVYFGALEGGSGEEGIAFGETRRRPTLYAHLKNFWELTDVSSLEWGLSHTLGSSDADSALEVGISGMDLTFLHALGDQRAFKIQSEFFQMKRDESLLFGEAPPAESHEEGEEEEPEEHEENSDHEHEPTGLIRDGSYKGAYFLLDWRFHPRWALGARLDLVDSLVDESPEDSDSGYSAYLTFHQSEFARWRIQVSRFELASGEENEQFQLQGVFAIGEHKHKLQ